ncbi:MAG: hypothetical protein K2X09_07740, partial [Rickettsiales bacterium]|nr:hypothetical protein [Rickettsiales bacterium]
MLKGNHLRVDSRSKGKNGEDELDWYISLNDREKIGVMNKVLAKYREPSLHRDKWKVSAIGITQNPDTDAQAARRHLAFVGVNTDMRSEQLDKDCAEQNMLSAMVNNISQYQWNKRGNPIENPPVPKEIHLMGGRDADVNDPEDKGEKIIAPCGKCTDTLASWMDPKSAVYIYPANNGNMPLKINDKAETLSDVKASEVWKTTIGHLNRYRHVALTPAQAAAQAQALDALAADLLAPQPHIPEAVIAREAENKREHRRSISELDVATVNGAVKPSAVNDYLHAQIVAILRTRMKSEGIPQNKDTVLGWLKSDRIGSISVVVVQHEDGSYAAGAKAQTKTKADRASSSSQLSTINSLDSIVTRGESPVMQAWSMNFSMEDIVSQRTTTPSKDGVERLIKAMN